MWSPDGSILVYSAADSGQHEQIFAVTADDWRPRRIGTKGAVALGDERRPSLGRSLWWSADGRDLYVLSTHSVAKVSMPGGAVQSVVRAPRGYQLIATVGPRLGGTLSTSDAGSALVAFSNDSSKRVGFARVNLDSGTPEKAWTTLREEDRWYGDIRSFELDSNDGLAVFLAEDAQRPRDIWAFGLDFSTMRQVTYTAPRMTAQTYGVTRLVEWRTPSGASRRGTLLLPAHYSPGVRYPLIVYPYPLDLRSNDLNVFGVTGTGVANMQLLATRGFAVFAPDVPPFDMHDQMRDLASIILSGVDRVIELGIADSSRLGIMGHSWGGYTVLALLVQTNRFKAAIMRGGYGDKVGYLGVLEASGWARGVMLEEWEMGGTVWEQRQRYIDNSPVYFLDRVQTPLLIIHGEAETTVPILFADQVFASLQRLGKSVEYARYAGENHSEKTWSYPNQGDYLKRIIDWFEDHLGNRGDSRRCAASHCGP
jgi:dipeptidyl aminopeptidase/acylaminoacyl peptidase